MSNTEQIERWAEIARAVFPAGAEISHPAVGESVWLRVRWKIGTDPKRPNKPAKGVNIYFTREFCKAYEEQATADQPTWDKKVRELLTNRYASFDPDHNAAHGSPMLAESWFVTPGAVRP